MGVWELYTRVNDSVPVVVSSEASAALSWLGESTADEFRERLRPLEGFREWYTTLVGLPTAETDHDVPVEIELDEFFHAIETLGRDEIAPELKGPHRDFYRLLYGGSEGPSERTKPVRLVDAGAIIRAYAWGKANGAYGEEKSPQYWGGTDWETWKETYADHVETEIRDEFTLTDLAPEEIDPLFDALTNAEASDLSKPVATYVMGSQWGQYTWDDVVAHFREHPVEASQVLSLFFDDSESVVTRLEAFREHTIHLTETEDRSPGSIERMATSLLMFTFPDKHLGLPPSRTGTFLEERSTLSTYESGFRPQQYRTIIGPLRGLRDDIEAFVREQGSESEATMLDIHSLIWIYGGEEEPAPEELPAD